MKDVCTQQKIEIAGSNKTVVVVVQDLRGGGAERVAILGAEGLCRLGFDVRMITLTGLGPNADLVPAAIGVTNLDAGRTMSAIPSLAKELRRIGPDLVISHLAHVNTAAIVASWLARIAPPVVVEHNDFGSTYKAAKSVPTRLSIRAAKYLYPRARKVVCVSDSVRTTMNSFFGTVIKNTSVLPNPVIGRQFAAAVTNPPAHPWLMQKTTPVIISAGRLHSQKNQRLLIEAFAKIRYDEKSNVRLIIFGEGPLRTELEAEVAKFNLQDAVSLPGYSANVAAEMSAADLFVLSSDWEGLPTVLIEALAAGCSVVSTASSSGVAQILGDGLYGEIVPTGGMEALAVAMSRLLAASRSRERTREAVTPYKVEVAVAALLEALEY